MAKGRIQDAIKEVAIPIEERRFTNVHNRMKGIKGLKRKERDLIASIDPDILGEVLKALNPLFKEEIEERAAIVMDIKNIVATMLKDIQTKLEKELKKGQTETANNVGRLVGLKVTTKGQKKNKAFMYDVTKGHRGSFK